MRKFTALLGVAAMLTILPATPALADGAVVAHDGVCVGALPDGNGGFLDIYFEGTANIRTTKSGVTTLTCHFSLDPEIVPVANLKARGFLCYTGENGAGETHDTRLNISPGGRAVLTCSSKPKRKR
jgi:hypothetical protein